MKPIAAHYFGCFFWLLVIAHHDVVAFDHDLAIIGEFHFDAFNEFAHVADAHQARFDIGIDRDNRTGLRQTISFIYRNACRIEKAR